MQFSTSSWIEYWTVLALPLFNWKKNEETASNWCKVYRAEVQPYIKWFYLWGTSSEHAAQYQSILYWSCTWQFYSRTCMHTEWNKWWHFDYFPDHSHFVLSQLLHQLTTSVLHFTVMLIHTCTLFTRIFRLYGILLMFATLGFLCFIAMVPLHYFSPFQPLLLLMEITQNPRRPLRERT